MAAAAPIAIGLQIASQVAGGVSGMRAANYNAAVDKQSAQASLQAGAAQENDINARARAIAGDAVAGAAANGVQVGTGSALDALRQTYINAQYNVLNARAGAQSKANAYLADASAQKAKGRAALIQGLLGAGAKALTGGAFGGSGGASDDSPGAMPSSVGSSFPTSGISVMSGYDPENPYG